MDKKSSTMKLDDLHSPRGLSKEMKSSMFKKKKNHLPDKDKQFLEEIMKRKTESLGKNLKNPGFQLVSEGNKLRGASESMQKPRIEKKIEKFTSSNFSNAETRAKNSSNFEKNNQDLKYFIGAGNNDALINKIFNTIHGWNKALGYHNANFIWTEVKQSGVFDLIPSRVLSRGKKVEASRISNKLLPIDSDTSVDTTKIYNKIEGNKELCSKKRLFINMAGYYKSIGENPFKYIPLTFHITKGQKDPNYAEFLKKFKEFQKELPSDKLLNNCWIVKPGESTNRGIGITVCSTLEEISACVEEKKFMGFNERTYIVQKYIYRPMLYLNRKFDIRCYLLITIIKNSFSAYFYKEGYLRTSCQEFDMQRIHDKFIHLTNDAVQKNSPDYGRFEDGNKLSYDDFQRYINENCEEKVNFKNSVYPKMKKIVLDTVKATAKKLDPKKRNHCFEVLGYDFMLDEMYNPWLLEVNTNPCLALSGKYLASLIPMMISHSLEIVLGQLFPNNSINVETQNQYELIYLQKVL